MDDQIVTMEFVQFLISRLERLSADSHWAHRASGLRGALLRAVGQNNDDAESIARLDNLVTQGFEILEKAAAEIPDLE